MPDFKDQRAAINKFSAEQESLRQDIFSSEERLKFLNREKESLEREASPNNAETSARLKVLQASMASLEKAAKQGREKYNSIHADLKGLLAEYAAFTDPRQQLPEHFSNETPFMLFPLRMETRFKTAPGNVAGGRQSQLWVRVYPDTCLVDAFDPHLSASEVNNTARFWAEFYAAGEATDPANPEPAVLDRQKAAWRLLVNAQGAGRAAWLAQSPEVLPQPGSVFPTYDSDKTLILTIASADPAILANQVAIFQFFSDLWKAADDPAQSKVITDAFPDAASVLEKFTPVNFKDKPPTGFTRAETDLKIALVVLPKPEEVLGKTSSWSQAAKVKILPERLVLIGYKNGKKVLEQLGAIIPPNLQVGMDPNAPEGERFVPNEAGDLEIPGELEWIINFDKAVENGMGFRVNLSQETLEGFDRLMVLGVRLSADESETGGQGLVQELLTHHFFSTKGLSVIPQGTPTNSTEANSAGASYLDDADSTFDLFLKGKPAFEPTTDWQKKRDGQWLAEHLGLPYDLFQKLTHADGLDQADAINMNLALWNGTLGYVMESMMKPVFQERNVELSRQFFTQFVSGRGGMPALRIGNQPYGILTTAAFNRLAWVSELERADRPLGQFLRPGYRNGSPARFIRGLYGILQKIQSDWMKELVPDVAHLGGDQADNTHQQLLDILSLHPTSHEFHHRYLQALEVLYSYMVLSIPGTDVKLGFDKMEFGLAYQLLQDLGYDPGEQAADLPLLSKLYGTNKSWEIKTLIDSVPLSEAEGIRAYTEDGKNYIAALVKAARQSYDDLRNNKTLKETPTALLFSVMKFALEQGFYDTAVRLHERAEVFDQKQTRLAYQEEPYVHQTWKGRVVPSRYSLLYKNDDNIAGGLMVADHIRDLSRDLVKLRLINPNLAEQLEALEHLENASTARLERAFVEHLDTCSYRLDAWNQGILRLQLALMRNNAPHGNDNNEVQTKNGLYVGAFGWLENVKPEKNKVLKPVTLPEGLKKDFPLQYLSDEANAGYLHAPSVNQAVTSAVLRNAFISHGKSNNNSAYAVNLSSDRVRLALATIEGMQNGQSLAALLGYQFERFLHDKKELTAKKIDAYIYHLRRVFPLNAEQIKDTRASQSPDVDPDTVPISAIEARNVLHGKRFIQYVKKQTPANRKYPFGFAPAKLPVAEDAIKNAINEALDHIMNIEDAVADLGMAESVHQVCMGNYDRAAGVLETYSNGNYPQTPDVIRTPRSGPVLTHRVGVPLNFVPLAHQVGQPRQSAEPSLNQWLQSLLPALNKMVVGVKYQDRVTDTEKNEAVNMAELGLSHLDLLYLLNPEGEAAQTELDERVLNHVFVNKNPRLDLDIHLIYTQRPTDPSQFSVFEVMPLIKNLRGLALQSGNLKPNDISIPGETDRKAVLEPTLDEARITQVLSDLQALLSGTFKTQVLDVFNALPAKPDELETESILQNVGTYLQNSIQEMMKLGRYGLPQTGVGTLYTWQQSMVLAVQKKVQTLVDTWTQRLVDYNTQEAAFNPADPDAAEKLQAMERLVSTGFTPADTITLAIVQGKKALYEAKKTALAQSISPIGLNGLFALLQKIRTEMVNLGDFQLEVFSLETEEKQIVRYVLDDLKPRSLGLQKLAEKQIKAANDLLAELPAQDANARIKTIEAAARQLFGGEFRMIPSYALPAKQAFEMLNAWNAETSLLNHLKTMHTPNFLNPKEDWLHGIARVREKMWQVENCILMRESLGLDDTAMGLHANQFPFENTDYHWLAMPFPKALKLGDGERMLYTAVCATATPAPNVACGLLLDEWTEVIPQETETTGLSFHYDRPNSEAPQTMLMVLPTQLTGNWRWDDLVDALTYTLESARLRAVEPSQIDTTPYARYLPATISAAVWRPVTIGMHIADYSKVVNP